MHLEEEDSTLVLVLISQLVLFNYMYIDEENSFLVYDVFFFTWLSSDNWSSGQRKKECLFYNTF